MKKLLLFFSLLLVSQIIYAQAPQKMSYQAVIRDAMGNLLAVNTNVGLRFTILKSGAIEYQETQTALTNVNSLISAEIGTGTQLSANAFSDIDWGNGVYFLQVEADPTNTNTYTITGSSQLLSVPYALHAANAVWQQNGNDIYYNAGNVGIGTASPANDLYIQRLNPTITFEDTDTQAGDVYSLINNTKGNDLLNFGVYNQTDARSELSFDGLGNLAILNGKLGIGTSTFNTPTALLEICGKQTDADGNISGAGVIAIKNNNYSRYLTSAFSNTSFRNSAIVGIRGRGTYTNPLNVQADDRVFGMYGQVYAGGQRHSNPIASIEYFVGTAPKSGIITFSTLDDTQIDRDEHMRLDQKGRLGIGSDDPKTKVHVKGGDIYLEDIGSGIIMKDANGNCWKITVSTTGTLQSTQLSTCPI